MRSRSSRVLEHTIRPLEEDTTTPPVLHTESASLISTLAQYLQVSLPPLQRAPQHRIRQCMPCFCRSRGKSARPSADSQLCLRSQCSRLHYYSGIMCPLCSALANLLKLQCTEEQQSLTKSRCPRHRCSWERVAGTSSHPLSTLVQACHTPAAIPRGIRQCNPI